MNLTHTDIEAAITQARKLARAGPRVSAVISDGNSYGAVPGYLDAETGKIKQVALVTPDGRVWEIHKP